MLTLTGWRNLIFLQESICFLFLPINLALFLNTQSEGAEGRVEHKKERVQVQTKECFCFINIVCVFLLLFLSKKIENVKKKKKEENMGTGSLIFLPFPAC